MNKNQSKMSAILFFLPFLVLFILFWVVPFIFGIYTSMHNYHIFSGNNGFIGLKNFSNLITGGGVFGGRFYQGMANTFRFVLYSFVPLVVISLILAIIVNQLHGWIKVLFRTIFFISYGVSVTAVSAIFKWLFNGNGGYINNLLSSVNLPVVQWLNTQPFAWAVIVVTTVWWTIGYNMVLFINALDEVDTAMYEAAGLDGANAIQRFWFITVPSIKSVLSFVMMTTIIASFNLYGQSLLITNGGPAQSTNSIIMIIQQTIFGQKNLGMGSAMALLLGLVMAIISGIQYWINYRGGEKA
ncbi:sugar ABC transporter permease [Aerococcaceae bacterium zg-ZJ1578]|uniref:carbohydrate ABC transporter permease n=1 Tax=Aerococcaceae bacterium zg-252 TaxID=2796928 RepID=UPI001A3570F8|nr:sugar ABC transporter permease [Aerococcaceae bacterium zg-1578]MBR7927512.1 sugar ABC transporter permease [Aerococcaceae bacterium zg-ZUI334]